MWTSRYILIAITVAGIGFTGIAQAAPIDSQRQLDESSINLPSPIVFKPATLGG